MKTSKLSDVERQVRGLLAGALDDASLRAALEELALTEGGFPLLTWLWGPELWRRNRRFFRPFVLARFSSAGFVGKKWVNVTWKERAKVLEPWLAEADLADDVELFRRLHAWKLTRLQGGARDKAVCAELRERFAKATSSPARRLVLEKFAQWFSLDELTALALYQAEPREAGPFILRHLPSSLWTGAEKRILWRSLFDAAAADEDFRWKLYRRQVPLPQWLEDVRSLAAGVTLIGELNKRHPEGWNLALEDGFAWLLDRHGRTVFPYVLKQVAGTGRGWFGGRLKKLLEVAAKHDWPDLRAALLRACGTYIEFSDEVRSVLKSNLSEEVVTERLLALCGVSREWNFPGFGMARVQTLTGRAALDLYERRPALVRGPFRLHLQFGAGNKNYRPLVERVVASSDPADEGFLDFLASRYVTHGLRWLTDTVPAEIELLAGYYTGLRDKEPGVFSRRAANVLGQVPAYTLWNYDNLIRTNPFARLLFERSAKSLLDDPRALADLVEAPEIHVQAMAYRALGCDDDRARAIAQTHLSILQGTLLRPLHRKTRMLAFRALENAAGTPESAAILAARIRDAMAMPDRKYPKEELTGLLGRLLHRWPGLCTAAEQPTVYRR